MKSQLRWLNKRLLLALVVIALTAGAFLIYDSQKENDAAGQQENTYSEYRATSGLYTLSYPSDWTVKEAEDCCEGEPKDWTKFPRPVDFIPPDKPETEVGYGVAVQGDSTLSLADTIRRGWEDNKHTPQSRLINGYEAEYVKVEFKSDAEQYTDHNYLIIDENRSIFFTFREVWSHQTTNSSWTAQHHMETFTHMLNSLKFQ